MAALPSGTVTFLFTDIEGSTTRWEHQPEAMQRRPRPPRRAAPSRHRRARRPRRQDDGRRLPRRVQPRSRCRRGGPRRPAPARRPSRGARSAPLRVRMALHTGAAEERDGDYYGPPLNRAARLLSAGHGGQVLLSQATCDLVRDDAPPRARRLLDLGEHRLKDLIRPERVFQVVAPGPADRLPAAPDRWTRRPNNLPVQPTPLLGREREVAGVARAPAARRRPPADADRPRRHRQDPPGAPGRRRADRPVRGRRLLRGAGPDLRSRPGRRRPSPRRLGCATSAAGRSWTTLKEYLREQADAAGARQLRADPGGRAGRERAARRRATG